MDNNYNIIKMDDGLWRIEDKMVHNYLVVGTKRGVMVDAGVSGGDMLSLAQGLTDKPISLICTHADYDHVMSAPYFGEVWLHPSEFDRFTKEDIDPIPMRPLWDGDKVDLGERALTVIHIPGHTPGSIALLDEGVRFLISGDSITDAGVYMEGEGRSMQTFVCSIERVLSMSRLFDKIHPAHGSPTLLPDILPELLDAGRSFLSGTLVGHPREGKPHMLYKAGRAAFVY